MLVAPLSVAPLANRQPLSLSHLCLRTILYRVMGGWLRRQLLKKSDDSIANMSCGRDEMSLIVEMDDGLMEAFGEGMRMNGGDKRVCGTNDVERGCKDRDGERMGWVARRKAGEKKTEADVGMRGKKRRQTSSLRKSDKSGDALWEAVGK